MVSALFLATLLTPDLSAQSVVTSSTEQMPSRQQRVSAWTTTADQLQKQGKWSEAERLLELAIAAQHDLVDAYLLRAKGRTHQGNLAGANADYTSVIHLQPEHYEARFQRALVLLEAKRYPEARADFMFLLEHPATETNAVYYRGEGRNNSLLVNEITTIQSNLRSEWLNAIGRTYFHEENYSKAKDYFNRANAEDTTYVDSYLNLGLTAERQRDTTAALNFYQKVMNQEPDNAVALRNLTSLARLREDSVLLEQIIDQYGGNSYEGLLQQGIICLDLHNFTEAITQFTQALDLQPNDPEALLQRGFAYEKAEMFAEALADYSAVIKSDPSAEKAYSNRGNVYFKYERYDQAVADYTQALVLNPTNDVALYNRAVAYQRLGQPTKACQDWQQAQTLGNTASSRPLAKLCEQ